MAHYLAGTLLPCFVNEPFVNDLLINNEHLYKCL